MGTNKKYFKQLSIIVNYVQSKNIVSITQSSFSLSPHIISLPPIMNHRSCDELGTYIPVT